MPENLPAEVTAADVDVARTQVATLESNGRAIRRQARAYDRQVLLYAALAHLLALTIRGRRLAERHRFWREGAVLLGPLFVAAGTFIVADYLTGWRYASALGGILGGVASVGGFYCLFFQPPTDNLLRSLQFANDRRALAFANRRGLDEHAAVNAAELTVWRTRLAELQATFARQEAARNRDTLLKQFLLRDWRSLRSIEFEKFLEDVLTAQGYRVETTKVTGDQGVDLVVAKDEVRIAIQVKGYLHSVGNEAVQQAYAGQAHYSCQACAVITNSRFTPSAVQLARSTRCLLIGEDEFPRFVLGKIDLIHATVGRRA